MADAACSHDPAQFVTGAEGTSYCPACEADAAPAELDDPTPAAAEDQERRLNHGGESVGEVRGRREGSYPRPPLAEESSPADTPKVGGAQSAAASRESEARIRRIVYCGEQLLGKRLKLWQARYDRSVSEARSVEELDEAMMRLDAKFPHLKLREVVEGQRG